MCANMSFASRANMHHTLCTNLASRRFHAPKGDFFIDTPVGKHNTFKKLKSEKLKLKSEKSRVKTENLKVKRYKLKVNS